MIATTSLGFHNYADEAIAGANSAARTGVGKAIITTGTTITTETINPTYRFYPHFHPYILQLVQRLNAGSVASLEAADTDYCHAPDGSLLPRPNSTRGILPTATNATLVSDGTALTLPADSPIVLIDSTRVSIPFKSTIFLMDGSAETLSDNVQVPLPGNIPVSFSSGSQFTSPTSTFVLPDQTPVNLTNSTAIELSDGTLVTVAAGTIVNLRSALPLPILFAEIFSATNYAPQTLVEQPYPVRDLDFSVSGAYSIYNWELFFHIPLLLAIQLSQNQKFEDAQTWFHYIFDPTDDTNGPTPQRFWKVNPFQSTDVELIENILTNLSTGSDPQLLQDTISSIEAWKDQPFQPFVIGRYRPTAFMLKTVMAYLDNLIAWGDSLFQQYTIETINEATQLYILAYNILGPRPQTVPQKASIGPRTYADLRDNLDAFGNALVDMEADIPFDLTSFPVSSSSNGAANTLNSIGQSLYFCVPRNDKLLAYWDTVSDRLFKIHNSLNIQGVFQALPLFDPPIDPALLVRAAAAGLDVSAIVSGLNQPLPLVRFRLLVAKATEICQEVITLGKDLLSAMEKQDNEGLSILRSQHETIILTLGEVVKYGQHQEAIKAREGLEKSLKNATQRYTFYQKLLGRSDSQIQSSIPTLDAFDQNSFDQLNFTSDEPELVPDSINIAIVQDSPTVSDGEIISVSQHETEELDKLELGRDFQVTSSGLDALSSALCLIPQVKAHLQPLGVGVTGEFGGIQLSKVASCLASVARIGSEEFSFEANKTSKLGTYSRRQDEWLFQSNLAKGEINQIFKQLRGAQLREAITEKEYNNHQTQIQLAQAVQDYIKNKETNQDLYAWMKRQVKLLYTQSFQLAFEVAKKAEMAVQNELGDTSLSYIQFSYLDGIEGLFAGEKLLLDVKTMEMAYHDLNQREYEMVKHVSLLQLAPMQLLQLRATGRCTLTLSEEIFDLDCPGHYFRRLKSVAVTIPSVTGPYTSVNCRLTLLNSSIRTSPQLSNNSYPRSGSNDNRFSDHFGSIESVVTSSGQSDSGLFETNFNDERYLPFELSGAVSQWQLDLPNDVRQFDFDTITDVVLHVRYTAREGGDLLKGKAVQNLQSLIKNAQTIGSVRLFSVRHEFPSDWAMFKGATINGTTATARLSLTLLPQHYPFWAQADVGSSPVRTVELVAEMSSPTAVSVNMYDKADKSGNTDILSKNPSLGTLLSGNLTKIALPASVTDATHPPLVLYFDNNSMNDMWVAITWPKS